MADTTDQTSANEAIDTGVEAGGQDNRLTLDPNDPRWADKIADWKDGQSYRLTAVITQNSPGDYQVTEVPEAGPATGTETEGETESEGGEETGGEAGMGMMGGGKGGGRYGNPAIAGMMKA